MENARHEEVPGILNETSMTIHRHEMGAVEFRTACGQTYHVEHGQLREVPVDRATEELGARKCGRCFEEGRGY
jgi:hypothetical protein